MYDNLTNQIDGMRTRFKTRRFVPGRLVVEYNGQIKKQGSFYNEVGETQFQLLWQVPMPGDTLMVRMLPPVVAGKPVQQWPAANRG